MTSATGRLGLFLAALSLLCASCEETARPPRSKAADLSQPLLIFDVSAPTAEVADADVQAPVDLEDLLKLTGISSRLSLGDLKISELGDQQQVISDCVSQVEPSGDNPMRGIIVWRAQGKMPRDRARHFGLFARPRSPGAPPPPSDLVVSDTPQEIVVENSFYRIVHRKTANGGLPSEISFKASGRTDKELVFNDRLHSKELGGFRLRKDTAPVVRIVASGPIRATVSATARYLNDLGVAPDSKPKATYRFSYSPNSPVIAVVAEVEQSSPFTWKELHFLELNHQKPFFPNWVVGEGPESGAFKDTQKSAVGKTWGALYGPKDALGLFTPTITIYDGPSGYGTYIHGPWLSNWSDTRWHGDAALYVGPSDGSFAPIAALAPKTAAPLRILARAPILEDRFAQANALITGLKRQPHDPEAALRRWQLLSLKRRAQTGTDLLAVAQALDEEILALQQMKPPAPSPVPFAVDKTPTALRASNGLIGIHLAASADGLALQGLYNGLTGCELARPDSVLPLWEIEFHNADGKTLTLASSAKDMKHTLRCGFDPAAPSATITVSSEHAALGDDKDAVDVQVAARLEKDSPFSYWRLTVVNRSRTWGIWEVRFPQIEPSGEDGLAAYPAGWGILHPVASRFSQQSTYPSGSCAMQFGSFNADQSGLYYAAHDGRACTKKLVFSSDGLGPNMRMGLGQYPEGMGLPAKTYEQPYDVVIGVFKGDWFTASKIYRAWALKQKWCSKGPLAGRKDVSPRIKNVALWALSGGAASQTISGLLRFKERFRVPLATHWYSWHVIPFDNSYPEYFPPKPGFKAGVRMAKDADILVMPYINGRLWDVEIVSFPKEAQRFATRDEHGKAYIEQYGSKRMLAPMCPWTKLWQDKVGQIVWRLIDECGVSGVYTDQVGAAAPRLCMDPTHGHPLGGGGWWVEGYDKMLEPLRRRIKAAYPDSFLTTESNAEPYIHQYDAYLMCNSTQGDLIPMFSSVYSDMILTFGRYTFESDAKDENAFYMKEGQLFALGGQLGWIGYFPADPKFREQGDYLKALSECRARAQKFMALGEMLHPVEYRGNMPMISGQWAVWRTKQKVELPAVMNSVWKAPDGTIGIALTNMSAKPVTAAFQFDAGLYGLRGNKYLLSELTDKGLHEVGSYPSTLFTHSEQMPPHSARFLAVTVD